MTGGGFAKSRPIVSRVAKVSFLTIEISPWANEWAKSLPAGGVNPFAHDDEGAFRADHDAFSL